MELSKIKDAFDRVAKKQKLSSSKTQDVLDQVERGIEQAMLKMQSNDNDTGFSDMNSIITELRIKLTEIAPTNQLEGSQKDLNIGLSKYAKILEKYFNPSISRAYRNVDFNVRTVNHIIASHFHRQGLFDLGDCFLREAHEPDATALKSPFQELYRILEAMRSSELEPALSWARAQSERLLQNGSSLELKLHQLQFVEILQHGSRNDALRYARMYLASFASTHKVEFQKLMACLLWAGRLDQSPYAGFMSPAHWEMLAEELTHQFCCLEGQSYASPLSVAIAAGVKDCPPC